MYGSASCVRGSGWVRRPLAVVRGCVQRHSKCCLPFGSITPIAMASPTQLMVLMVWIGLTIGTQDDSEYEIVVTAGQRLGVEVDASLEIKGFTDSSALEEAGVDLGDRIVSVNAELLPTGELLAAQASLVQQMSTERIVKILRKSSSKSFEATPKQNEWTGWFELARAGKLEKTSRGHRPNLDVAARVAVTLANFGAQRPNSNWHAVVFEDTACNLSHVPDLRGAYVVAPRGECSFGQKALFVSKGGGSGVVIFETAVGAPRRRLDAESSVVSELSNEVVAVWTDRTSGSRLVKAAADASRLGIRLQAKLEFDTDNPEVLSDKPKRGSVREAFKPSSFVNGPSTSPYVDGVAIELSGGAFVTVVGLTGAELPVGQPPDVPRSLIVARPTSLCNSLELRLNHSDTVALALVDVHSCLSVDRLLALVPSDITLVLLDIDDPLPLPESYVPATEAPFALGLVAPISALLLRNATRQLNIERIEPRPRLLRTWRELSRLTRMEGAWPDDPRLRVRIFGAIKRVVGPKGDEPDPDQWELLQATWASLHGV